MSKYKSITSRVQKYTFKVQSNFRNLRNRISGIRNLPNTFGSRNPVPRSRNPGSWNLGTHRNRFSERFPEPVFFPGTAPARPEHTETILCKKPRNLGTYPNLGTLEPVPGTSSPGTYPNLRTHRNRFLEPRALEPILTSEPWNLSKPRNLGTGSWNLEPWNLS